MFSIIRLILFCSFSALLPRLIYGQGAVLSNSSTSSLEEDWQRLKTSEDDIGKSASRNSSMAVAQPKRPASDVAIQIVSDYLARADALRDFRASSAANAHAGEAKRLEALMLVHAAFYGDDSARQRCDELVAQVRADQTLPADDRFSLASFADFQPLRFQQFASGDERLAKYEQTARALIKEFPTVAGAYEEFLCLAKDCPEAQAARIARDLLALNASAPVKADAQNILDRQSLIGSSLQSKLSSLSAQNRPALAKGSITILYPWTIGNGGSLVIAQEVAAKAPSGATVIGVNLDADVTAAHKVASEQKLPGVQIYDPAGSNSKFARDLKLAGDNVVFVANRQGMIVSVTGRPDLTPKINSAAQ